MLGLVLAGCVSFDAPSARQAHDPRFQELVRWSRSQMEVWQVPGVAIGILEDGVLRHRAGLGVRDLGTGERIDTDTRFRLASISKSMTAAAVLSQVDAGRLDLQAPASAALPGLQLAAPHSMSAVTLEQLMGHSGGMQATGLPTVCDTGPDALADVLTERAADWSFWAAPDQFFNYANNNYALAGLAAEQAAGVPFPALVAQAVFEPLGLERTTYDHDEDDNAARGHSLDLATGEPVEVVDFSDRYCGARFPSGGVISTVEDLGRFAAALLDGGGPVLSADGYAAMTSEGWDFSESSRYGYGIQVSTYKGHRSLLHTGSLTGFQSILWLFPDDGVGIIVLVNSDHFIDGVGAPWSKPTHRIAERAAQLFLDDVEVADRAPAATADVSEWAARYTGTFYSAYDWGTIEITEEDGTLWFAQPEDPDDSPVPMAPYSMDRFSIPTTVSDGRTYYPTVSFEVVDGRTEWLISSKGIAQRID